MKTLLIATLAALSFSTAFAEELIDQNQAQDNIDFGREIVCHARDGRGLQFDGVALRIEVARQRALDHCRAAGSAVCIPEGCDGF